MGALASASCKQGLHLTRHLLFKGFEAPCDFRDIVTDKNLLPELEEKFPMGLFRALGADI